MKVTRPDGGVDTQSVNPLGQVTGQSGKGITPASFGYDGGTGQLNDLKLYPAGTGGGGVQETKWGYDAVTGAMTSQTLADNTTDHPDVLNYTYTGVHLTSSSGQGVATTFGYNSAGEQTGSTSNDTSTTVMNKVTAQDDQGNPTAIVGDTTDDITGKVTTSATDTFTYSSGKLTSENQQAVGVTVHYDYYAKNATGDGASPGALMDMKQIDESGDTIGESDYAYDPISGRLQTISVKTFEPGGSYIDSKDFTVNYRSQTNIVSSIGADGATTTLVYDTSTGNLQSISTTAAGATTPLYSATYTYNANDQRDSEVVTQLNADGSTSSHDWIYTYDSQDELTSVVDNSTDATIYSYSYDSVGNRTNAFGTVNSLNQYSDFTYNSRGDLTDDGTYTYTYDAADRLTEITANDNSVRLAFQYDGEGRRIQKDVYTYDAEAGPDDSGAWVLSYTRRFAYDGKQLIAEMSGDGQLLTAYTWGTNGLMSVTDYSTGTPTTYITELNASGNVVGLVNASTGAVAATYTYDPYGKLLTHEGPAEAVCNELSDGGYYDRETDDVSEQDRVLSLLIDRFLTQDPTGISGGLNPYPYSKNDPVNFSDPTGDAPTTSSSKAVNAWNRVIGTLNSFIDSANAFNDYIVFHPIQAWNSFNSGADTGGYNLADVATFRQSSAIHAKRNEVWDLDGTWVGTVSNGAAWTGVVCIYTAAGIRFMPVALDSTGTLSARGYVTAGRIAANYPRLALVGRGGLAAVTLAAGFTPEGRDSIAASSPDPYSLVVNEANGLLSSAEQLSRLNQMYPYLQIARLLRIENGFYVSARRTIGIADMSSTSFSMWRAANSGPHSTSPANPFVSHILPDDLIFSVPPGYEDHADNQLIEWVARQSKGTTGRIILFIDHPTGNGPCQSCAKVIQDFRLQSGREVEVLFKNQIQPLTPLPFGLPTPPFSGATLNIPPKGR